MEILKHIQLFAERIMYEGYTYAELCAMAGGGDSGGGGDGDGDVTGGAPPGENSSFQPGGRDQNDLSGGMSGDGSFQDAPPGEKSTYQPGGRDYGDMRDSSSSGGSGSTFSAPTLNTAIPPATEYTIQTTPIRDFFAELFNLDPTAPRYNVTAHEFNMTERGLSITSQTITHSYFDFDYDSITRTYKDPSLASIEAGTLASSLYSAGFSFEDSVTVENIATGIATVAAYSVFGASSLTIGLAVANTAVDTAYARESISMNTYASMKGAIAVAQFAGVTLDTMEGLQALSKAKSAGFLSSTEAILGMAATLIGYATVTSQFLDTMEKLGLNEYNMNDSDISAFASSGEGELADERFKATMNVEMVLVEYSKWLKNNETIKHVALGNIEGDPFDYMAGGVLYNEQKAGSATYYPDVLWNPRIAVDRQVNMTSRTRQSLFQEDSVYKDLLPLDTAPKVRESDNIIAIGKRTRLNRLIDQRNTVVERYNEQVTRYSSEVSAFNSRLNTFKTQAQYDSALSEVKSTLNSIENTIKGYQTQLDTYTNAIDELLGLD